MQLVYYYSKLLLNFIDLFKMSADYLKRELISHTRRVCSLYKRMYRDINYHEDCFFEGRYKQLELRQKFDKNKNIKDMRVAKALLDQGETDFQKTAHPYHIQGARPWHPFSKHGISEGRELESPDYVMDMLHPLEKSRYPYWFAKREQMKDAYINLWKKKFGRNDK